MALEIEGKIIQKYPEANGVSKSGNPWRKQTFIVETQEQYPKKIAFDLWNDNIDALKAISSGDMVKINFRVESREFNDKWYTNLTAWKIAKITEEVVTGGGGGNTNKPIDKEQPTTVDEKTIYENEEDSPFAENSKEEDISKDKEEDDLPF